jgi:HPt (histidine-containing phosphotransfer) domain-containing protein
LKAALEKLLPTSDAQSQPVNIEVLVALVGDDPGTIRDLLLNFRSNALAITDQLTAACATGLPVQVAALAHKLKSSAQAVGALSMGKLCEELEMTGKAGKTDSLGQFQIRLVREMAAVDDAVTKLTGDRSLRGGTQ